MYDPAKSREWKARAQIHYGAAIRSGRGCPALSGPLAVHITAMFPCPKSSRGRMSVRKTSRPDCDNIAKAALDAGNGILWADDAQVVELRVWKWVGYDGQEPFVEVTVRELEAE